MISDTTDEANRLFVFNIRYAMINIVAKNRSGNRFTAECGEHVSDVLHHGVRLYRVRGDDRHLVQTPSDH
ncbi:hypothetical protein OVA29_05085 [Exiguobacterium sp. SL14]|nr:hypothetical protein [Exiguobacterium sp. SL14]MCY1690239.1 hypothetical protein [Exiguobacterium sp. SL14]